MQNRDTAIPDVAGFYREWVWALQATGRAGEAVETATVAAEILSDPLFLANERYLSLPIVYETVEEIGRHRTRFSDGYTVWLKASIWMEAMPSGWRVKVYILTFTWAIRG